jgi:hypothetical protein
MINKETLEELAENQSEIQGWGKYEDYSEQYAIKSAFINGYQLAQEIMYSEKEMKQYACQCVANFLSNSKNELEQSLIEVIISRFIEKLGVKHNIDEKYIMISYDKKDGTLDVWKQTNGSSILLEQILINDL